MLRCGIAKSPRLVCERSVKRARTEFLTPVFAIPRVSRGRPRSSVSVDVRNSRVSGRGRLLASVEIRPKRVRDAEVGSSNLPHPTKVNMQVRGGFLVVSTEAV